MKAHTKVPIAHSSGTIQRKHSKAATKGKSLIYERQDWYEIIYESIMMAQTNIIY